MHSSKDRKAEKLVPFFKPPMSKPRTSAEIISEARNALRTIRTQRPFTPRDEQRKLFGPASSRAPEHRPPSSFSLHASSFESPDSRPVSGARLSPLHHRPKLPASAPKEDEPFPSFPKPPLHPAEVRKISSSRARLFKTGSQGSLLPDKGFCPEEVKKQTSLEEPARNCDPSNPSTVGSFTEQDVYNVYSQVPRRRDRPSSCPQNVENDMAVKTDSSSAVKAAETEEETGYWDVKISPVLLKLEEAYGEGNLESLCLTCTCLHQALEEGNLLGKRCKRRAVILKALFKLVELGSDLLGLKLAKLILALKVSGKNLLNICKLVFKISRSENNDCLFQNDSILDSLLEVLKVEDLQTNSEAILYCMAAIKFLSGNTSLLHDLLSKEAVELLVQLMKQINGSSKERYTIASNLGHLLVQLTAALRNLADLPQSRHKFLVSGALSELCVVLEQHMVDSDVCTNIARLFSKLSSYNDCCAALGECTGCYRLFLDVLTQHSKKQDLVVRIIFTIGNLTAKNNKAREQFYTEKGSVETLLSLFQTYCELDMKANKVRKNGERKNQKCPSDLEDILIKLIRVIANISIHPNIGAALSANQNCVDLLIKVLEYKSIDECEELVINASATINNLSYYHGKKSVIQAKKLHIAELLLKLLLGNSMHGILEAARVFGNLSQYREVRDFIVKKNVHKFMIALMDAKHQDVCFSACGVLINLTVDGNKRDILKEDGGIKKLVDCLRDFGPSDWQLASSVCKTLWNYSEHITNTVLWFGEEEADTILELLSSFLDEETALDCNFDDDLREYHKTCWQTEFKPVALQLLDRIQRHHTYLEPLPAPSL
ncbi:armadillo repeat-containing protein 2 [Ambystoma mexicanum]|uniref:armadillo repeat-containing protein 2 n=1 Tax=Ambystoma mexicanum TaxID=8296 RepID=UPI0037E8E64C